MRNTIRVFVTNRTLGLRQLWRRVLLRPLLRRLEVRLGRREHLVRDRLHQRVCWVRLAQKLHDRQKHLADGQCRRPVVLNRVQTNHSVGIDVAVVDAGSECNLHVNAAAKPHFGGLERIILREVNIQEEDAALVGRILRAVQSRFPFISTRSPPTKSIHI